MPQADPELQMFALDVFSTLTQGGGTDTNPALSTDSDVTLHLTRKRNAGFSLPVPQEGHKPHYQWFLVWKMNPVP